MRLLTALVIWVMLAASPLAMPMASHGGGPGTADIMTVESGPDCHHGAEAGTPAAPAECTGALDNPDDLPCSCMAAGGACGMVYLRQADWLTAPPVGRGRQARNSAVLSLKGSAPGLETPPPRL